MGDDIDVGNFPDPDDPDGTDKPAIVGYNRKEDFYTVLLAGTNSGLTDVLMVAAFDVKNGKVDVVNIPRDTYVNAKRSVPKINGSYNTGGIDMLMDEVESVIGFRPDNYALVDYEGFKALVDTIGGVKYNVPIKMFHRDDNGKVDIDLQPGMTDLNGEKALGVVRFRNAATGQDLGRISRTQDLLMATAKQTLKLSNLTKVSKFANIFAEYVKTDLALGEIMWFGEQALKLDTDEGIEFHTLPIVVGSYKSLSYVFVTESEALELINSTINPYTKDITDVDIVDRQSLSKTSSSSSGGSKTTSSSSSAATSKPAATPTPAATSIPTATPVPDATPTPATTPAPGGESTPIPRITGGSAASGEDAAAATTQKPSDGGQSDFVPATPEH
jgi:LCP family protein required for cell wall assembly